jgi:glycerate 2-kinase
VNDTAAVSLLRGLFASAVANADPARCVPPNLPAPPRGRTVVVGAGKAAAAMAAAVEAHWPADRPLEGLVVTRYGHGAPCHRIEIVEAAHPTPDAAGENAARRMLDLTRGLGADDLLLCLISGGGSSLLALPAPGLSLSDKRSITSALLRSGAPIDAINCVRKHLSAIKGGRLAVAAGAASVVSLIISDVPGDDLSVIASGPTVADPTTCAQALEVLARWHIAVPPAVERWLQDPAAETPKPGDAGLRRVRNVLIAAPRASLDAACQMARAAGVAPVLLGDDLEGEAGQVAQAHARLAFGCRVSGAPARPPCVLISGGETTVTVRGSGRGGRNAEFLLALAVALDGAPGISAIACDTDGIDGTEDNAGAVLRPDTLARGLAAGLDAAVMLANNDAYGYFSILGDLVMTGPTRTNVNDFRALLIE